MTAVTIVPDKIEEVAYDLAGALYAADERRDGFLASHAPAVIAALADAGWSVADVLAFGAESELAALLPDSPRDREIAERNARGIANPWRALGDALLAALEPRGNQPTGEEREDLATARRALEILPGLLRDGAPRSARRRAPFAFATLGSVAQAPKMLPGQLGAMVYAQGATVFYGEPEHGKSLAAQEVAVEAMAAGLKVVHLDGEQGGEDAGANYLALQAVPADLASQGLLHYEYDPAINFDADYLAAQRPGLVIVDSFARLAQARGVGDGQYTAQGNLVSELQAFGLQHGCAVLVIDHSARNADDRYAVGGGSKLAAARGQWKVKRERKFTPDTAGVVSFTNTKARRAGVPPGLRFACGGEGIERFSFRPVLDKSIPADRIELDILEFARRAAKPLSKNAIRQGVDGNNGAIDAGVDRLVKRGALGEVSTGVHPKFEATSE